MHPFLKAAQEITVIIAAGIAAPGAQMTVDTVARHITIQSDASMMSAVPSRKRPSVYATPAVKNQDTSDHFMGVWRSLVMHDLDIPFDPIWGEDIGYFDMLPYIVDLPVGERRASYDNCGRKMIMVGGQDGTTVVFKRFSDLDDNTFAYNLPSFEAGNDSIRGEINALTTLKEMVGDNHC